MSLPPCKICNSPSKYDEVKGVYMCSKCFNIPDEIEIPPEYFNC